MSANGTFRLEAALYDGNYLFVPSRYVMNPEIEEDGVLTGSHLLSVEENKTFSKGDVIQIVRKSRQPEITGKIRWLENGEDTDGSEVFGNDALGYFVLEEDYTVPDEILTEFTLGNAYPFIFPVSSRMLPPLPIQDLLC